MKELDARRLGKIFAVVAAVSLLVTGCKSDDGGGTGDDEASAVQAEQEERDEESSESEQGAAAETEESGNESGERAESPEKATVGEPAPDFTRTDATGEEHSLADYRGQVVVLEWTSTECPYVKRHYEEETFEETLDEFGGGETEVQWLAIDSSNFAKPEASKKWKKKYDVDYPFLMDPSGEVGKNYGAKTTPHMYVIDEEGTLRYNGAIDDDDSGEKDSPTNYVTKAVQALKNDEEVDPSKTEPYGCSVKYEE